MSHYFTLLLLLLLLLIQLPSYASRSPRYPKPKTENKKPKPLRLNTDNLPNLQEILTKLELIQYLPNFIKIGVTETRLLLRLTSMDYHLMSLEFDGITDNEIVKLKDMVNKLIIDATVIPEEEKVDLSERNKLTYGRIYLSDSVQSYEYKSASFGGSPPIGKVELFIPTPEFGCDNNTDVNYTGKLLVVKRGNCTFLEKALNAKKQNASALLIVNSEDRLDSPASGYGIDKNVSESSVLSLESFPVISTSNNTWAKFQYALQFNKDLTTYVSIVPLKCGNRGVCSPVTEEEKLLQSEVSWGHIRVHGDNGETRSYEFLTSNFGCQLPTLSTIAVVAAEPIDGCSPLIGEQFADKAVLVHRGGCRFDVKSKNVQDAGGRLTVIVDVMDNALQRIGGMHPDVDYVGIPSIIVNAPSGEYMLKALQSDVGLMMEVIPAKDSRGADLWIDLAFTEWSADDDSKLMQLEGLVQKYSQLESGEIVAWLKRRMDEITDPKRKNMDTDEHCDATDSCEAK